MGNVSPAPFPIFSEKKCMKLKKEIDPRGWGVPRAPLGSDNELFEWIMANNSCVDVILSQLFCLQRCAIDMDREIYKIW